MLVLFYLFVFIGVNFVTVGVDSKDTKQESTQKVEETSLKANFEDAEILSKFYNDKGYFIVVYNGTTKAPEVFQVDYNEWELMSVGELY
ncbi:MULTISPECIES: hypothetical protein [Streptococcus]|uniref:hypothetical protein n=1 Tax=Streptococcus TaxID=1301 RepID=UPI001E461F8A|nr:MULTISPECIES: hypothetical protein [Streptococcus]